MPIRTTRNNAQAMGLQKYQQSMQSMGPGFGRSGYAATVPGVFNNARGGLPQLQQRAQPLDGPDLSAVGAPHPRNAQFMQQDRMSNFDQRAMNQKFEQQAAARNALHQQNMGVYGGMGQRRSSSSPR